MILSPFYSTGICRNSSSLYHIQNLPPKRLPNYLRLSIRFLCSIVTNAFNSRIFLLRRFVFAHQLHFWKIVFILLLDSHGAPGIERNEIADVLAIAINRYINPHIHRTQFPLPYFLTLYRIFIIPSWKRTECPTVFTRLCEIVQINRPPNFPSILGFLIPISILWHTLLPMPDLVTIVYLHTRFVYIQIRPRRESSGVLAIFLISFSIAPVFLLGEIQPLPLPRK